MRVLLPALLALAAAAVATAASKTPPGGGRLKPHDGQVKALLSRMTLDEKIGQMTQA
jgi:hypothetical protein